MNEAPKQMYLTPSKWGWLLSKEPTTTSVEYLLVPPNTRQRAERAADRLNSHGLFTQGTSLIRVADIIAAEFEK